MPTIRFRLTKSQTNFNIIFSYKIIVIPGYGSWCLSKALYLHMFDCWHGWWIGQRYCVHYINTFLHGMDDIRSYHWYHLFTSYLHLVYISLKCLYIVWNITMAKYCKAGRVFDCAFELQVYQHLFTPEQVLYVLYVFVWYGWWHWFVVIDTIYLHLIYILFITYLII